MLLAFVVCGGMFLVICGTGVAPDSTAPPDNSTGVTVNVVNPQINTCAFWDAGSDNIINLGGYDDVNRTNQQVDVDTFAGTTTYFWITVSLFGGNGILDLDKVTVVAWFDNGTETDYSTTSPRNYPNRNLTLTYNFTTGMSQLLYPTTGEVSHTAGDLVIGFTNATTQELGIGFRWGPNIRWAPGDGSWDYNPGWNDIDSWNFQCLVSLKAGGNPKSWEKPWHKGEFGTYKRSTLSASGNPSTSLPPGSGWTSFSGGGEQQVTYTSNAPMKLYVNITNLQRQGGGGTLTSNYLGVSGERLFPFKPFWDAPGGDPGDGYNYLAGANGTSYSSYAYINAGNGNLTGTGPTTVNWYASVPIGTLEGRYTATIRWTLELAVSPSP